MGHSIHRTSEKYISFKSIWRLVVLSLVAAPFLVTESRPAHATDVKGASDQAYEGKVSEQTAARIQGVFEEAIFPESRLLAYLLESVPEVDRHRLPLTVKTEIPEDPKEPIAIVFFCGFGPLCEPMLRACRAVGGQTTDTTCRLP